MENDMPTWLLEGLILLGLLAAAAGLLHICDILRDRTPGRKRQL